MEQPLSPQYRYDYVVPSKYALAKCALAEYNDAYEQGGEIDYPFWAERIIRGYEEML